MLADYVRQGYKVPVLGFDIDHYWRQNYQERDNFYPRIHAYRWVDWGNDPPLPDCDKVTP